MFRDIIYEVANGMYEVSHVESADETEAIVYFYSNSRKKTYPYAFRLYEDGKTVEIRPMATGPFLNASAPRFFAEAVAERLSLL